MISTVKIGISNIIESQTLSSSYLVSFFRIPIYLFEINNFLNLLVSLVFHVHCWTVTLHMNNYPLFIFTIRVISLSGSLLFFKVVLISLPSGLFTHVHQCNTIGQSCFISFAIRMAHPLLKLKRSILLVMYSWLNSFYHVMNSKCSVTLLFFGSNSRQASLLRPLPSKVLASALQ